MNDSAPTSPISFSGSISERDFCRVQALLLPVWARWYVFAPCVLFVFVNIGVGWSALFSNPRSAVSDLLFGAVVLLASAVITKFGRRRNWRNTVALSGSINGLATQNGIEWNSSNSSTKFEWAKLIKSHHENHLALVFYTPRCAFYFPRDFFNSEHDWEKFNSLVLARIAK